MKSDKIGSYYKSKGIRGERENEMTILFFVYMAFGYWATGRTIYANKILIGTEMTIFMRRLVMGTILGWILIPIAVIKMLLGK